MSNDEFKRWYEIWFMRSQILAESKTSVKMAFPSESPYADYSFWVSKKLVKDDNMFILGANFVMKAAKERYEDGKYSKENELEFNATEIKNLFDSYAEDYCERIIELKPTPLEPIQNPQPLQELLR